MKVKYTLCGTLILAWLTLFLPWVNAETVTFGANESPPYWSQNLPENGMCGAIVQAISKEAGLTSVIQFKPLKRLIADDANNDLGNPEFYLKRQDFAAIIPIAVTQAAFFYYRPNHREKISLQSLDDLKRYKIGALKGTLSDHSLFAAAGIRFEQSSTQTSLLKKLKLGRIDLYFELDLVGRQAIRSVFPGEADDFGSMAVARSVAPIAIMIAGNHPDGKAMGDRYREGLKKIINNGSYLKILENYYGTDAVPENWYGELARFQRLYAFEGEK
jgi:polar amino acid transport system substrate-binding protein